MRLNAPAALGVAALATVGGIAIGLHYAPDSSQGYWTTVATYLPTGSPVYVKPTCTLTKENTFSDAVTSAPVPFGAGGPIPPGFTPVRAVRCGTSGDGTSATATQSEIRDPSALKAMMDAYRTTHIRAYVTEDEVCDDMLELNPAIALVDAHGVAIMPGAPRGVCDAIIPAVGVATRNELWTVTESATVHYP